jgi:Electron transfer DM13
MSSARIASRRRPLPVSVRVLAVPLVALVLLTGIWVTGGLITNDFVTSMVLTAAWVVGFGLACAALVRRRREMWPALAAFVVTAAAAGTYLGTQTLLDHEVHENVVTARSPARAGRGAGDTQRRPDNVLLARGRFESLEHGTTGTAQAIEVRGVRRVLTLTRFETSPGPDLRVHLATADANQDSPGDFVDLGGLKGNIGDQQYEIPNDADLGRLTKVVIWCRAFSVGFGAAPLRSSDA